MIRRPALRDGAFLAGRIRHARCRVEERWHAFVEFARDTLPRITKNRLAAKQLPIQNCAVFRPDRRRVHHFLLEWMFRRLGFVDLYAQSRCFSLFPVA